MAGASARGRVLVLRHFWPSCSRFAVFWIRFMFTLWITLYHQRQIEMSVSAASSTPLGHLLWR